MDLQWLKEINGLQFFFVDSTNKSFYCTVQIFKVEYMTWYNGVLQSFFKVRFQYLAHSKYFSFKDIDCRNI